MNPDHGAACTCSAPGRAAFGQLAVPPAAAARGAGRHAVEQAAVPAGVFVMGDASGDENPGDGETPLHEVALDAFAIDATPVTNDEWARFARETGFRTDAERWGFSAVFHLLVAAAEADVMGSVPGTPWWWGVRGADWSHPGGRDSSIAGLGDHPVVHVSWDDALAYCAWAGRRLPTEAEWERAARGGLEGARYPWGDEPVDDGGWRLNIFQGSFPAHDTGEDGWIGTAPVRSYAPNGFGLWQAVGNVWEWCGDWYDATTYASSPRRDPRGPASGAARVLRGGSHLCHASYCNRYRNSARSQNTPDSSAGNIGFRTVAPRG